MVQSSSGQSAEFDGCQMSFRCVYQACQCRHLGHIGGMNGTEPTSCQQEKVWLGSGWSTKPWLGIKDFSIAMLAVTRCDSLHVVWWMSWMLTHWGLVQLFSNSQRKEKRSQIDWSTSLAEKLCTVFKGFLASVKNYFTTCLMCFSITRYCLCCLMVSKFNATLVWNTEQGFAWSQHVWI